jgi:hypothetical protein
MQVQQGDAKNPPNSTSQFNRSITSLFFVDARRHIKKEGEKKKRDDKRGEEKPMLWIDKYRPQELGQLTYHAEITQ